VKKGTFLDEKTSHSGKKGTVLKVSKANTYKIDFTARESAPWSLGSYPLGGGQVFWGKYYDASEK